LRWDNEAFSQLSQRCFQALQCDRWEPHDEVPNPGVPILLQPLRRHLSRCDDANEELIAVPPSFHSILIETLHQGRNFRGREMEAEPAIADSGGPA
jgi:hypothetical protein